MLKTNEDQGLSKKLYNSLANSLQVVDFGESEYKIIRIGRKQISSKIGFKFIKFDSKNKNLFLLEEVGDLLIINLKLNTKNENEQFSKLDTAKKFVRLFDFNLAVKNQELSSLCATQNCFRIFASFNTPHSYESKPMCSMQVYERTNGLHTHHFPHLLEEVYDSCTNF